MIGITLGDPAGIGAEVTCRALKQLEGIRAILIGSGSILQATASHLGIRLPSQVELRDFGPHRKIMPGRVQPEAARIALWSLQTAARMLRQGEISGVVTAPVSKLALLAAGFGFPGQTEFFAAQLGVRHHAMMAYVPSSAAWPKTLRIVLATIHLPLAKVPESITVRDLTQKIRLLTLFLQRFEGFSSPRIAVLALNPHAQEFTCGAEKRIARAVRSAQRNARTSLVVEGPFPADTLKQLLTEFDGIVAMYHDQAMIPAKLLATGGVNVTLGLPFPRTSPLHGTAFDIAERYLARPESMIDAIKLCQRMTLMVQ